MLMPGPQLRMALLSPQTSVLSAVRGVRGPIRLLLVVYVWLLSREDLVRMMRGRMRLARVVSRVAFVR